MSKTSDKIFALHNEIQKRTKRVAAFIVMRGPEHVGTIQLHYPADGAGRLIAYVADWTLDRPEHIPFDEFTRWRKGTASGYGYDKASAAMSGTTIAGVTTVNDGYGWEHNYRKAGLTILQAI